MKHIFLITGLLAFVACKPIETNPDILNDGVTILDNEIDGNSDNEALELKPYRATETVLTDLINTKLEVKFLWNQSRLVGKETLTAKPHFYSQKQLVLDAKGMEISAVAMNGKPCVFTYENDVLTINLDKEYSRSESYTVVIDYLSKPDERTTGGSAAITSDKGLYFINPKGEEKNKMPQIWTQGETEANSVWFPTIDSPNSKSKQEIYLTVDNKYATLSNGKLISSTKNTDGTRTDYWKQELPHAPYLFMMGVGEFKIVKDFYTRTDGTKMEVNYYVEPEWEANAKAIFGETPAMIGYFSNLLGVEYPWDKYSQIVVRDYVSGAMENTGAVIFGDYVYKNNRELLDANDNSTIAHELFHHWFGDLVTCESWSNLTVNESFANYSQFLWDEHRYGLDEADYQAMNEQEGYKQSALGSQYHNLVWFDYDDKEQMFDGHTYNKGGRILHMLRNYIGDETFFAGIKLYLKTNSFKAAEYTQLRLAFEEVSGQDLNWFFNQWYLDKGHPNLNVEMTQGADLVSISVEQKQTEFSYFKLPVDVAIYDDRGTTVERIWIENENETFELKTVGVVKTVIFDKNTMLLADLNQEKPHAWFVNQYTKENRWFHRREALVNGVKTMDAAAEKMVLEALNDAHFDIRSLAIAKSGNLSDASKQIAIQKIKVLVENDPHSYVRADALQFLSGNLTGTDAKLALENRILKDSSYLVVGSALVELNKIDNNKALELATTLENEKNSSVKSAVLEVYSSSSNPKYLTYFKTIFEKDQLQGGDYFSGARSMVAYVSGLEPDKQRDAISTLKFMYKENGYFGQLAVPRMIEFLTEAAQAKKEEYASATNKKADEYDALIKDYSAVKKELGF